MKRLKKLVVNSNKLVTIPKEVPPAPSAVHYALCSMHTLPHSPPLPPSLYAAQVGRLEMLEELVLSENNIEELPGNLTTMSMLRVLKVSHAVP